MLLEKKNIIVVGGTSGIGKSAVKAFINEGAFLTVVGRNSKKLSDAKALFGDNGITIEGDASNQETINIAIKQAVGKFGDVHGLYHVAGGSGRNKGDGPIRKTVYVQCFLANGRAKCNRKTRSGATLKTNSKRIFCPSSS